MSKDRLTKKQLQTDELQSALVHGRDYVASHAQQTTRLILIVVGAGALIAAIVVFLNVRAGKLATRLSKAIALYEAPLVTDGNAPVAGQQIFKDAAERTAAVKKDLEALAKDSPKSKAGRAAAVMLLAMEGAPGATGTRIDAVKSFADSESGSVSAGIAAVSLLEAQAAAGRANEAIEIAKRYLDSGKSPLPKDVLIFTLASLYEKAGKPVEARSFYQRVASEFPESPMRFEAQQKAQSL